VTVLRTNIVIRNGTEMRLVRNLRSGLAPNEVAVEVTINVPQSPRTVGRVTIDLPAPPPATVTAIVAEYPEQPEGYADEETYREDGE
jgi:hypothetical protein